MAATAAIIAAAAAATAMMTTNSVAKSTFEGFIMGHLVRCLYDDDDGDDDDDDDHQDHDDHNVHDADAADGDDDHNGDCRTHAAARSYHGSSEVFAKVCECVF